MYVIIITLEFKISSTTTTNQNFISKQINQHPFSYASVLEIEIKESKNKGIFFQMFFTDFFGKRDRENDEKNAMK